MINKTISLSLETYNQLKEETNASALIEKLCRDYFTNKNKDNLTEEEKLFKLEQDKQGKIEIIQREVEKIEEQKKKVEEHKRTEEEEAAKVKVKSEVKSAAIQKFFLENLGRELSAEELADYIIGFERGDYTAWDYLKLITKRS